MTKILARKKNGKKCRSVTGFKNVEGVLSKHLKGGIVTKSRLEILELDHSDNLATYSCEADNAVGSSMDTVDIRVLGIY